MDNSGLYVGLDIGTTSIKVIVAERVKNQLNVIGMGNERSKGLSRGVIVDIDQAAEAIRGAVDQAQEKASIEIKDVIVGVPSNMLKIEPCTGLINLDEQPREINDLDVRNVAAATLGNNLPKEREIIDIQPEEFIVDGFDDIKDPRGMVGMRLEMRGHLISGSKGVMHNIQKAVQKAGLNVRGLVLNNLAEGHEILNDGEQDFGTILIDLGGGQTSAVVIHDHQLKYATTDPEGGDYITKDISIVLNTSMENAEKLKRDYGYADSEKASTENEFPVDVVGQTEPDIIDEKYLSEIIEARLDQILSRIKDRLDQISALELPGGIVLTGEVAALPGILDLAQNKFDVNTRIYIPDEMGLRHPSYSAAISVVSYYSKLSGVEQLVRTAIGISTMSDTKVAKKDVAVHQQREVTEVTSSKRTSKPKEKANPGVAIKKFIKDFFD